MGKTRELLKKIRGREGSFHAKMGLTKYRNVTDLKEAEYIKKKLEEYTEVQFSSVQFSRSVVSDSLRPHES